MSKIYIKRFFIFLLFPVLIAVSFFVEDMILKIVSGALAVIYAALLVFLRKTGTAETQTTEELPEENERNWDEPSIPKPDDDESFTIVSRASSEDIITSETIGKAGMSRRDFAKPEDLKDQFEKIANEKIPDEIGHEEQFSFVLDKVISIIKDSYHAYSVVFFWYNRKTEKFTIEHFLSASKDIEQRKYDLEDDILSTIVKKAEPEVITDIRLSSEADQLRYYRTPQGVKSFVGVPIFYENQLIAVLAMDSKESDAFGIETIFSLGRFVRLLTILIGLFEEKYSVSLAEDRLQGMIDLINPPQKFDGAEFFDTIDKALEQFIEWDAFTFILYHPIDRKFLSVKVVNKTQLRYIPENQETELDRTLIGKAILQGLPVNIDDTSQSDYNRFYEGEDVQYSESSFLAIPLVFRENNYGVLCFENLKKNAYSRSDVKFVQQATGILGFVMYSYSTEEVLKKYLSHDLETGALKDHSFFERLGDELARAKILGVPGAAALIQIDDFSDQSSLFEADNITKVIQSIAELIKAELTVFNVLGRLSERQFAVYFFNTESEDAYLWAEKLRKTVARHTISILARQTSFTISAGVVRTDGITEPGKVFGTAELALKKAVDGGGNKVTSY